MNPFVILKRNKIRLCMYMLLFFSNVSCGQNRTVVSDKEQESSVLYDVQGLKYEQLWRFNNTIVRDCYFTRKGEFIDNATWNVEIQTLKSSRLFPLSYLFQKNQYKCDIVPSLPTGLCGIEPVEHAPV